MSEEEYARIVRDLGARGLLLPGSTHDQVETSEESDASVGPTPTHAGPRPRRAVRRNWLIVAVVVLGLCVAVGLVSRNVDRGPSHAFLQTRDDGSPVTYSSCKPVRIAVYPAGGPAGAESVVREAVDAVAAASGLDMVVLGSFGGHAAQWNFQTATVRIDDPVVVSWQDGEALARMTSDVAGLGGSPTWTLPSGTRVYAAGTIALSRDHYRDLEAAGDRAEQVAIVIHELGHVLGLGHVDDEGEIMAARNSGQTTLGPGDREGLRALGRGPCV